MPVINFGYRDLCSLIGEEVPVKTLIDRIPMIGADMHETEGDTDEMSVEFFPDRPDLYSVEGLAREMRAFLDIRPGMKRYDVGESDIEVIVDDSVLGVRPYFRCGIVRDVEITDTFLKSIMEMQEKLHITIGRKRSKLAIGIHDMSQLVGPITYRLADPHSIRFVPLASDEEMDMAEILVKHEKGKAYAHLLKGYDKYPIIQDSKGQVLSFPPIINGRLTTVTVGRHDLFIDVTGNDLKAVKGALDIVATSLAERGGKIQSVVMNESGRKFRSPDLSPSKIDISAGECDRFLGLSLGPEGTVECLRRMGMEATSDGDTVHVTYPCTRLDIMHKVDIFEDVATGYGFDRFGGSYELTQTLGGFEPTTTFTDNVRDILVGMGYMEVNTRTLSSEKEDFQLSRLPEVENVKVLNPITEDHTCLRSYLMPSLVRILRHNKHRDLPQRIFEVGYVIRDQKTVLHLCVMATAWKTPFSEIKAVTEGVLRELSFDHVLENCEYGTFIPGRGAEIRADGRQIGFFGEMAPEVVVGYGLTHPVMFAEIDLDPIIAGNRDTLF
ncbi:MAG: phenylalanine--tRNA ligase subunit beta [Candidatus Methanomethylophilaceae archaeon]|nr:phenylalanine--tRNA ligase subunit beta [Candidatus Methanomethylophilaceae archaeon]